MFCMNKRVRGWLCLQCVVTLLNNLTQRKPLCYLGKMTRLGIISEVCMGVTLSFSFPSPVLQSNMSRWVWMAALFSPDSSARWLMLGHHRCERDASVVLFWLWTRIVFLLPAFTLPLWCTQGVPRSWAYLCVNKRKTDTDTPLCLLRGSTSFAYLFIGKQILVPILYHGIRLCGMYFGNNFTSHFILFSYCLDYLHYFKIILF